MHVDENDFDVVRNFRQFRVRDSEWIVRGRHKDTALEIEHCGLFPGSRLENRHTTPRIVLRVVCRPQEPRIRTEVRHDLFFVPDVVSGSQDINSPIEEFVCDLRCDTEAGSRILAIENRQVDGQRFLQFF